VEGLSRERARARAPSLWHPLLLLVGLF